MLLRDVRLGAMGRYADRADAEIIGAAKLVGSADTRQDQRGQHRLGQHLGHRLDPFPIGVRAEAIVEAGAVEAVAMRYPDRIDAGLLERLSDSAHMRSEEPTSELQSLTRNSYAVFCLHKTTTAHIWRSSTSPH